MVKGLLIEIKNWETGSRAYGINPLDKKLVALGGSLWQSLDHEPKGDWEVRVVLDDRDLSQYEGRIILDDDSEVYSATDIPADATIVDVDGVIVLNSNEEINAVLEHIPDKLRGKVEEAGVWAEKKRITVRSVEEEIKSRVLPVMKAGHRKVAEKRKKPIEHIVFGHPAYAFIKKLYEVGCPYVWKERIPRV